MLAFHFLLVGGSSVRTLRCYSSISTPWCLVSSNIACHDVPIDRCPLSSGISQLYGRIVPITTINHHFFEWYNGIICDKSPFWRVKFHFNPHGCEPSSTQHSLHFAPSRFPALFAAASIGAHQARPASEPWGAWEKTGI